MAERGLAANDGRDARFARLPRLDLRPRVVGGTVVANPQFPVAMRLRHEALEERVDPPAGVPSRAGDVDVRHRRLRRKATASRAVTHDSAETTAMAIPMAPWRGTSNTASNRFTAPPTMTVARNK